MGKKIEYQIGDLVGKNNHVFLKELPQINKRRRALFLCGVCKQREFESRIEPIQNNRISSCGCLRIGQIHNPYGVLGKNQINKIATNDISIKSQNIPEKVQKSTIYLKYPEGTIIGKYNSKYVHYDKIRKKTKFICGFCGNYYYSRLNDVERGKTMSCGCISHSAGETLIEKILKENNISFVKEKTFSNLRNKNNTANLRFDFYLENENYLIEFDGQQHFMYSGWDWNTKEHFEKLRENDNLKNDYCKRNNIPLIRIPYTQLKNLTIDDLLLNTSSFVI